VFVARLQHSAMRCLALLVMVLMVPAADAPPGTTPAPQPAAQPETPRAAEWESSIAALTDPRPAAYDPAIESLIRIGEPCLADVVALKSDDEMTVRMRVVTVAAGIGGPQAQRAIVDLSRDNEWRVRELAALGLGKTALPGAYDRLIEMLDDRQPDVRKAAARGLAELGDARALDRLAAYEAERDPRVRDALRLYLGALAENPLIVPALAERLEGTRGPVLHALIDAASGVGDPRLAPALATLVGGADLKAAVLAARSLAANGDSRALEALTIAADQSYRELGEAAAASLRTLTGHGAGAGAAWTLWWRDHAADIAALAERDRFIAELHDQRRPVTRDELAAFSPDQLMPLVDGVLGDGARWWPLRAYTVLALDDASRWTAPLTARIGAVRDAEQRLALIVLLDQLGDPAAKPAFERLLAEAEKRARDERRDGHDGYNQPERAALKLAIARR